MAGSDEQRDSAAGSSAGEPGAISRLLVEIFQIPEGDLAASWREPIRPGDVVGRYEIRREIGRGGFGAVYEAFDPELGRTVALKALKPGRTKHQFSEAWIKKEAEAVAKLDHPAIVTIFDVGTCPAGAYLVMELLRGETLAKRVEEGPLPVDEALRVAEQMAEGLVHAHSRGVLHRDLKPANVFVCEDGRVKLLDFGLAHLLGTEGSSGAGTPAYMAPEQAAGAAVDERADVWAAGMVLGEMLTGRRPVERTPSPASVPGDSKDGTELMWGSPPAGSPSPGTSTRQKLTGVPRPVAKALDAALSEDPGKRPKDGKAWLTELRSARLLVDRPRRIRRVAAFATAFVLIGLAVAGFATWRIWERQVPGGRPTVGVADFANETGDKDLDGLSGLLTTSLEQGTRLRVLTRGRMLDVLKQLGKGDVDRIDEPLAREVGKETRADALLLTSIHKLGDIYVVEMRALDPLHDEYVFTVSDKASGKEAIFELVDRLGDTTRRRLRAGGPDTVPQRRVATITTANPEAWDLFFRARQAADQGRVQDASNLAEAAIRQDPDFALARFLAIQVKWPVWGIEDTWPPPEATPEARQRLESLEALSDRLPEKERLSLKAMRAGLDGRWSDASLIRNKVAEEYPLDKEAQFFAGDVRYHSGDEPGALPYFRRALRLDPGYRIAAEHLADALLRIGRASEEIPWLREEVVLARSPGEIRTFAWALLSAGLEDEAEQHLRKASALDGQPWPPYALLNYLTLTGRAGKAEQDVRNAIAQIPEMDARTDPSLNKWIPGWDGVDWYAVALNEAYIAQGRFRDSAAFTEALPSIHRLVFNQWQAGARGDLPRQRDITQEAEKREDFNIVDSAGMLVAFKVAVGAAMAGDFETAGAVARKIMAGTMVRGPVPSESIVLSGLVGASEGEGRLDQARRELGAAASVPQIYNRYLATLILGQFLRTRGDCVGAIAAFEKARVMPWHPFAGEKLTHGPLVLHSLALCYEQEGDIGKARARNEEMLKLWARADPDIPLLIEAKAMRDRLAVR